MAKKTLGVNPWTAIWVRPRKTISKIVRYNPKHRFLILSFLYGLPMLLHTAQNLGLGEGYTAVGIVIVAIVLAIFVGMLGITIASALLYWTGKWIGGTAKYIKVRAAVSWSYVPNIIAIIIWAVLLYYFRGQIFFTEFGEMNFVGRDLAMVAGALIIQAVLAVWSFIILVKGLGEVQGFSSWKAVLNILIPFFMVGIVVWFISWAVFMATGLIVAI